MTKDFAHVLQFFSLTYFLQSRYLCIKRDGEKK